MSSDTPEAGGREGIPDEAISSIDGAIPACTAASRDRSWRGQPANVFPKGYSPLCTDTECFGPYLSYLGLLDGVRGCSRFDVDHEEITAVVVRSATNSSGRALHVPEAAEDLPAPAEVADRL